MVFLGGKDYQPLFCSLTARHAGRKLVFYNSARSPELPGGFVPLRYSTPTRTNWPYQRAWDLIAGTVVP